MKDNKSALKLAGIVQDSIVDGPGLRFVVFTQGCMHQCEGCHNKETHDPSGGEEWATEQVLGELFKNPLTQGVTLSGGEPFLQAAALLPFARAVKKSGLELAAFSGFCFEEILADEDMRALLELCDVLIDGKFVLEQKTFDLKFRGSKNQRIIDVQRSLAEKKAILSIDSRWV